jgi:flagellar hook-associated protein 3 FlgL
MSGSTITPMQTSYGTANYGLLGTLTTNAASVKQTLDTLTEQASTGLISQTYAGLGAGAATSLLLAPALAQQTTWSNNINAATGQMQVAQTALTQISSIASTFYADCNNLNGLNPSEIDSVASSANAALSQVAGLLDSTDGSTYVFAGQDSQNPPVPNPDNILGTGFVTQIAAAVGNLATSGAAATIASTLATASSNASGTSPFSAALSQPAASLSTLLASIQVGDGQQVPVGILASGNAAVSSTGSSTTGSYTRDILRALATLGSLSSSQVNDAGFQSLVSDTYTSLGNAITALNSDAGVMGNTQAQLATTQTEIGTVSTTLQSQVSNAQNVDMATTLSRLSLVQTQLQSSYRMIATVEGLALTNFLPVPA